ncbi:metal ABC transporter permease [Dichotomicrobium thermohalophilum]|uniref:High-affinity zinc uptake system membrane protein ZnuB n=1 Tax=Dichotomicrobium thermohalophilum TaxID=933063 RepID=A0A397Q1U6_9HYPH|nr:metal ABC transporter permease [Dichotomicrobium thermohalophilum]RIA55028.1 zinc transport system permease protein [Dichotomicrobium thermohalophilum]
MLDDFFMRALIAGSGVALAAGPLGCFIVWRRMAYFGDTISHSALLGVALGFLADINLVLAVFAVAGLVAVGLMVMQRANTLSSDAILGILSHSTLAIGLVIVAFMTWLRIDLMAYLFGDILAVTTQDIAIIYGGGAAALAVLALIWTRLLADTVSFDVARAEGLRPEAARFIFMLLVAAVVALTMKVVGILLITALLIIPGAAARNFATTPETMAVIAAGIGVVGVVGGLHGSLYLDTPAGPTIVVAALLLFLASLGVRGLTQWRASRVAEDHHAV